MRPFAALLESLSALVQGDAQRLERALRAAPPQDLYGQAARHKCASFLLEAFLRYRPQAPELRPLRGMLQRYAGTYALGAGATREQIGGIIGALRAANLPNILLKSSAGVYAGDPVAERSQVFDIDVMIRESDAGAAVQTLRAAGYEYEHPELAAGYRAYHHHLAPLVHPAYAKPLELHLALAPPGSFSTRSDWSVFEGHLETCDGPEGAAARLDSYGSALHYALHGAGLYRLGDALQVARIAQRDPHVLDAVMDIAQGERVQRVALQSVLAAASRIAGLDHRFDRDVGRYLAWAAEREDLPRLYRGRTQLADAWFANGCRIAGPSMRLALPPAHANDGRPLGALRRTRILAGRLLAGGAAAARCAHLTTA